MNDKFKKIKLNESDLFRLLAGEEIQEGIIYSEQCGERVFITLVKKEEEGGGEC